MAGHVATAVTRATSWAAPEFDFAKKRVQLEGWININGQGAFNAPHDHPGWVWSGTYYVSVPASSGERSGAIEFLDNRTNARVITIDGAPCFFSKWTLQPRVGTVLVFPSYLRHWVYPNDEREERVSVAFNARFVPRQDPDEVRATPK